MNMIQFELTNKSDDLVRKVEQAFTRHHGQPPDLNFAPDRAWMEGYSANLRVVDLVRDLIYYLDVEEVSDEGKAFRPNFISSCRANDGAAMAAIFNELNGILK